MKDEQIGQRRQVNEAYLAKLRDPRWQKKRLEVMQRDDFTCLGCCDSTTTLNVHHKYYVRGLEPWEYELSAFATLCENCHEFESFNRSAAEGRILLALKRAGFLADHLNELAEALKTAESEQFAVAHDPFVSALAKAIADTSFGRDILNRYFESIKKK